MLFNYTHFWTWVTLFYCTLYQSPKMTLLHLDGSIFRVGSVDFTDQQVYFSIVTGMVLNAMYRSQIG